MTTAVLECRGLTKRFGQVRALAGVDLTVGAGEVLGFLGPNGAGKSTTIRGLLGQIKMDSGTGTMFGYDIWKESVRAHQRVAYVPGDVALWPGLTGGECIDLLGSLQGHPNPKRRADLIERFDFDPTKRTRSYSKGNRQKVALIAALSTNADLLLLDEPTSGLDPLMEAQFQAVVRERVEQGTAALLSSHIMSEVEALCERVSIIRAGVIVSSGSLAHLRAESASTVECTTSKPVAADLARPGVEVSSERHLRDGVHTSMRVNPDQLTDLLAALLTLRPLALTVQPPSLDELFLSHYQSTSESASELDDTRDERHL